MLTRNIPIIMYSMPLFVLAMVVEFLVLRRRAKTTAAAATATMSAGTATMSAATATTSAATVTATTAGGKSSTRRAGYRGRDTFVSLALGVLSMLPGLLITAANVPIALWAWHHRLFTLGTGWTTWVFAIVLVDFVEYWNHRAGHRVRFLWANHVQHHSSEELNLSTSLRTPLTSFSNIVCFPWLAIFGIQPWVIFASFSINAVYQLWLHTEAIGKLPRVIEFIFNTPSHHRVHHGSDGQYIDKNFGGIFIVFDRMFGSFQPEGAPVTYGLVHNIKSFNLWTVVTHEYTSLVRDVLAAKGIRAKLGTLVMPPGWQPKTARTAA